MSTFNGFTPCRFISFRSGPPTARQGTLASLLLDANDHHDNGTPTSGAFVNASPRYPGGGYARSENAAFGDELLDPRDVLTERWQVSALSATEGSWMC
jgi:hypothetical protein